MYCRCRWYRCTSHSAHTTAKIDGKVLFSNSPGGPLSHRLEGLLGQGLAYQLPLDGREQEEIHQSEVQQIGNVFDEPEVLGCHQILHHSGCVDRSVIPMEKHSLATIVSRFFLKSPGTGSGPPQCSWHWLFFPWAHSLCRWAPHCRITQGPSGCSWWYGPLPWSVRAGPFWSTASTAAWFLAYRS